MNNLIACYLKPHVSAELKHLAVLAGSESDAVERLIEFWNANHAPQAPQSTPPAKPVPRTTHAMWRSTRGDELPVGAKLEATYKGRTYFAFVEQQGIRFDRQLHQSPSAAGRAVKKACGVTGKAAQTDGRTFWSVRDPSTGRSVPIKELNPRNRIDPDELLLEIVGS